MKHLKGFGILFLCLMLGRICRSLINFPIPEVVYGMVFLLIFLVLKVFKLESVEDTSKAVLGNLAFLFVPLSVSLMDQVELLGSHIVTILITLIVSNIATMAVTAKVISFIQKRRTK